MADKGKQAARDRMAEILLYNNIQNTGPYSGQVGPEDPRAGDDVMYNGPGFHDGYGARGGPFVGPEDPRIPSLDGVPPGYESDGTPNPQAMPGMGPPPPIGVDEEDEELRGY